jgi:hypothetical protein
MGSPISTVPSKFASALTKDRSSAAGKLVSSSLDTASRQAHPASTLELTKHAAVTTRIASASFQPPDARLDPLATSSPSIPAIMSSSLFSRIHVFAEFVVACLTDDSWSPTFVMTTPSD